LSRIENQGLEKKKKKKEIQRACTGGSAHLRGKDEVGRGGSGSAKFRRGLERWGGTTELGIDAPGVRDSKKNRGSR